MKSAIQAIRGMNDILPEHVFTWQHVETHLKQVLSSFGYQEIRLPILEQTDLFKRSIGEVTDIVEKEMYTFEDRNGDNLSLRPEGTAGCVRAAIEHGLLYNQIQRLWYLGPMFRHERPQKGRYRQFYQLGVEAFGMVGPDIDVELIAMTQQFWQRLNISEYLILEINTLGTLEERQAYKKTLVAYLKQHEASLDADSQRRLHTNPLRILDSKNKDMAELIQKAPTLYDTLGETSKQHFKTFCEYLDALGISYTINSHLVRGLDYYTHVVFEWVTDKLGAQNTICAGGRYDGLVEQLGGRPCPAAGFAMGLERIVELISAAERIPSAPPADVYLILVGGTVVQAAGLKLAHALRQRYPALQIIQNCGEGGFKQQFKKADKSGARLALILGEDEVKNHQVSIKYLREDKPQLTVTIDKISDFLNF